MKENERKAIGYDFQKYYITINKSFILGDVYVHSSLISSEKGLT